MDVKIDLAGFIKEILQRFGLSDQLYLQISVAFIIFALSFIAGWVVYHIFEHYFSKLAKKTKTTLDDEIIKNVKKPVYFLVVLIGFYYGIDQLTALDIYSTILTQIFSVAEILLAAFIIARVINVFVSWYAEKNKQKKQIDDRILNIFKKFLQGIVYLLAFLVILHAFNVDLSGVVIGLGVGGIAIAFALQNVLSDIFSAFSIYFDKPFEVGDFIIVGQHAGTVKKIGMKSTRLQLLQGEELILSNREATTTSIRNFKKMEKRRVEFSIRVAYDTPLKKLKKIPDIIKKIIEKYDKSEFDMIHFTEFGNLGLNFQVVYYIKTGDYNKYLDVQQDINFAIMEAFDKEGIQMGYQTKPSLPTNK
ncbi:MAG: mechanosensitive ion channel family protein [Euryarchaeota archaeon]|nr:mechanosensitive ion channel family protein [Euryarchaeota archaeon]